jgi:hypothetical protein
MATGQMAMRTPYQIFCETTPVLVDGMCGGPVCNVSSLNNVSGQAQAGQSSVRTDRSDYRVVRGMVEGIVPAAHPTENIRNTAVFIEAGEIRSFLTAIEDGTVKAIIGGEAQKAVAEDQDPEKMDISKFL